MAAAASLGGVPIPILIHIVLWGAGLSTISTLDAAYYRAGVACAASPASPGEWSGSAHCTDRQTVIAVGTQAAANLRSIWLTVHLLTGPMLGALADHHGRVRTILICVALMLVSQLAASLAASSIAGWNDADADSSGSLLLPWPLLLAHVLCGGISAPAAAVSALCNDYCPPEQRNAMYTMLAALHGVAGTTGMLVGTWLLGQNIEDYGGLFLGLSMLLAVAGLPLLRVREPMIREAEGTSIAMTEPAGSSMSTSSAGERLMDDTASRAVPPPPPRSHTWGEFLELCRSLWHLSSRSRFLQWYCVATALEVGGLAGYSNLLAPISLATLNWPQGRYEQMLLRSALPTCVLSVTASNRCLFARLGANGVVRLTQLFLLGGHACLVTMPWFGEPAVYLGGALLGLCAGGMPAGGVLLAERFPAHELAQVHALLSSCVALAVIIAVPAFANAFHGSAEPSTWLPVASLAIVAAGVVLVRVALATPPESVLYRKVSGESLDAKGETLV